MATQNLFGDLALDTTVAETNAKLAALTKTEDDQIEVLEEIEHAVQAIASTRGTAGDLRVTIVGGGVTISSGTVTTVTGITNIGGFPANQLVPSNQNLIATIANVNNIGA